MRKRIINKKVRNDIYIKLWKKSMYEHMRNIVRLDTEACLRAMCNTKFEDRFTLLNDLERASLGISNWLWVYDYNQLKNYCMSKYHISQRDFHKIKL